jgi:hypothetical protein
MFILRIKRNTHNLLENAEFLLIEPGGGIVKSVTRSVKCSTVTPNLVRYVATFGLLLSRKSLRVSKFEE